MKSAAERLKHGEARRKGFPFLLYLSVSLCLSALGLTSFSQSGRSLLSGRRTTVVQVVVQRTEDPNKPKPLLSGGSNEDQEKIIPKTQLEFFDGGVLQKIESF